MALFNAFANSKQSGGGGYPVTAAPAGAGDDGGTVRQTILGLEFDGPRAIWGGKVNGSVYMDFFAGGTSSTMRIRTASVEIAWKDRSVAAGLEKPIFNPREPSSLAQVGVSPLTGAGNLWLWLPQVRIEQEVRLGASSGVRAQLGAVQTREIGPYVGTVVPEAARPAAGGLVNFHHKLDDQRRMEIAAGFHASTTHAEPTRPLRTRALSKSDLMAAAAVGHASWPVEASRAPPPPHPITHDHRAPHT